MFTACPYCGTSYFEARSNCQNCGAALPPPLQGLPETAPIAQPVYTRSAPPMPPRPTPRGYLMRRLSADAGAIVGLVFSLMGITFLPVGAVMAYDVKDNTGGRIFGLLGLGFLLFGPALLLARLAAARRQVAVLRDGQAALGRIETLRRDATVEINGRSPWVLFYSFNVLGQPYRGKIVTLRDPDSDLRPAAPVYVLYDPSRPENNTLYLDL